MWNKHLLLLEIIFYKEIWKPWWSWVCLLERRYYYIVGILLLMWNFHSVITLIYSYISVTLLVFLRSAAARPVLSMFTPWVVLIFSHNSKQESKNVYFPNVLNFSSNLRHRVVMQHDKKSTLDQTLIDSFIMTLERGSFTGTFQHNVSPHIVRHRCNKPDIYQFRGDEHYLLPHHLLRAEIWQSLRE